MPANRLLVIPAAGAGSRLGGDTPKVLVPVAGRPMIDHLLVIYRPWADGVVVVAHPSFAETLRDHVAGRADMPHVDVVEQRERTGMLDAVLLAAPAVARVMPDEVWVTWGDQVGVLPATIARLADAMTATPRPSAALPTVHCAGPYTHFERDTNGRITRFLQRREGDAMPAEGESDMGLFALTRACYEGELLQYAATVRPGGSTGERNFVPFVAWLAARNVVATVACTDTREAIGINTPDDLRTVERWLSSRPA
jgi:bifunctional UDP-N-acetylglucosamine pyrophosphorylase / glucosamine-1-phosphate N-acetyltransferase